MYTLTGFRPETRAGLQGFNPPPFLSLTPGPNEELRSKMKSLPFGEKNTKTGETPALAG